MSQTPFYSVVTTVQPPSRAVRALCHALRRVSGRLLVMGDAKGPRAYPVEDVEFWSLKRQLALPLRLARLLPVNHYARKNLGYLLAIGRGATCLYETDDDNQPIAQWGLRSRVARARLVSRPGWCNVYRGFTSVPIWPRGFPLNHTTAAAARKFPAPAALRAVQSPIQQGLVDGSPDVDAIWRLVCDQPVRFERRPSVALGRGVWCPFNSQSTWWWPEAFPLLYLPSCCNFRLTDIWRSFVAQRCIWEWGGAVTFHASEVAQRRNIHDLMRDFQDELPGYLSNDRIRRILEDLPLEVGPKAAGGNLWRCYEALVSQGVFPKQELRLVRAWLEDLGQVNKSRPGPESVRGWLRT